MSTERERDLETQVDVLRGYPIRTASGALSFALSSRDGKVVFRVDCPELLVDGAEFMQLFFEPDDALKLSKAMRRLAKDARAGVDSI